MLSLLRFGFAVAFLLVAVPAFAAFPDVLASHPNSEAIAYVQSQGIVQGYPDGTYRPDRTINRAEFTKIIVIAKSGGLPQQGARACFKDVRGDEWFATVVCWALGYNAINGYPDGTFRPAQTINFVEAAKIIANVFDPHGMSPVPLNEPWYRPFVQYLDEKRAIPISLTSFDREITRGEMAEMIYRLQAGVTNKPSRTYEELGGETDLQVYCDRRFGWCFDYSADWQVNAHYFEEVRDGLLGVISMDHPTIMTGDTEVWISVYEESMDQWKALLLEEQENRRCVETSDGQSCVFCELRPNHTIVAGSPAVLVEKRESKTQCEQRGQCTQACTDTLVRSAVINRLRGYIVLIQTAGGPVLLEQFERILKTLR